ncbi:MAG: hypothetical protein DCF15_04785 [Phormidesmis priestleyi]|uniref:PEP-CTERM sorting domain-containing protein n=1 Tax=Phormidesmis priestleyi TaxID=268141 RepID=A0A2W4XMF4_9CYAN|nr:MAG: hypothetical protein DCF15_04785 [Phormidesmis priestleyi]
MHIKQLALIALATTAATLAPSAFDAAQAATLGTGTTCAKATFAYMDCAGAFAGNDKGAQGTALTNLNTLFGSGWSLRGDSEVGGIVSFLSGGTSTTSGVAKTSLTGPGAIAVKAGNSYSLYTVNNLATFNWNTLGVTPVGKKGNTPNLSHISVYARAVNPPTTPRHIPEPGMLLGLVAIAGAGVRLKQKGDSSPAA